MKVFVGFVVALLASIPASHAQDKSLRENLGTRITASAGTLVLDWDSKHPWSSDIARGTTLVAEYNTRNQGVVLQRLSQGKLAGANVFSMRFILPDALTVSPTGPVCFFFQISNGKVLPIRKPDAGHSDTSHFRDELWESAAVAQTGISEHQRFLTDIKAAADNADRQVDGKKISLERSGWTETDGCKNISAPAFTSVEKPYDVLPLDEQSDAARRVCVTRVLVAEQNMRAAVDRASGNTDQIAGAFLRSMTRAVMPPDLSAYLLDSVKSNRSAADNAVRQQQLVEYQKDWLRFSQHPDDLNRPILGDATDEIDLQALTRESGGKIVPLLFAWFTHKPVSSVKDKTDPADVIGFAGGELEAYSRCVVEGKNQLRSKLEQWETSQANAPRLREMARKELMQRCEQDLSSLSTLIAQQKVAHDRLQQAQQAAPNEGKTPSSLENVRNLNAANCSVR
jgi:hypothetical protein